MTTETDTIPADYWKVEPVAEWGDEPPNGKVIYISGPMRGYAHYNFPAFDAAESKLRQMGYTVINPARLDKLAGFNAMLLPDDADWTRWPDQLPRGESRLRDLWAIRASDHLYMLRGWGESDGANWEWAFGVMEKKGIFYET